MKKEIVFLSSEAVYAETFTTSDVIAEYAGVTHRSINRTISRILERLSKFGKVRFKITPLDSGQKAKVYLLNEEQATLLITFLKNTERVADFKENLVHQFFLYKKALYEKQV